MLSVHPDHTRAISSSMEMLSKPANVHVEDRGGASKHMKNHSKALALSSLLGCHHLERE